MKRRLLRSLFCFCFVCEMLAAWAQDPQLSQFYASQLYTNPAFAGADRKLKISGSTRNQYTALRNSFKTSVFSVDAYSSKFNGGVGLLVSYDQAGDGFLQTINVSGIYSYV